MQDTALFVLGLKGTLSELELHTIRARMSAGLLNKAERGDLALALPIGLTRDALGRVIKEPNREVQDRLALIFTTFLEQRSASKVLQYWNAHDLLLPRRDRFGDVSWKRPTVAAILSILKNPAYAGAFVYGRTRTSRTGPALAYTTTRHLPIEHWRIRVNDRYPAYIEWETFERIQAMLQDNYAAYDRNKTRGIPRPGKALLHGIVACGECGHKMVVQYKGRTEYLCNYLRAQHGVPVCQLIPADAVDDAVVAAFFAAMAPVELDAYARAVSARQAAVAQVGQAHQQQLTRLRFEADLAQRHFTRVDPENRLVAAELERRWEAALGALKEAEAAYAQPVPKTHPLLPLPPELQARFAAVGQHLPQLWAEGVIGQAQKKALLRTLIALVVVHRTAPDRVQVRIVWQGGETSTLRVPVRVGSWAARTGAAEMEAYILAQGAAGTSDAEIARHLTAQGYRSPMAEVVLPSTVRGVRYRHRLLRVRHQSHPRRVAGYLTVSQLAQQLDLAPPWIYDRIHKGTIQVAKDRQHRLFLFPDRPETLAQLQQLRDGTLQTVRFGPDEPGA